jgi:hypothetical protein
MGGTLGWNKDGGQEKVGEPAGMKFHFPHHVATADAIFALLANPTGAIWRLKNSSSRVLDNWRFRRTVGFVALLWNFGQDGIVLCAQHDFEPGVIQARLGNPPNPTLY